MYSRQRSYSSHQAVAGGRHRSVLRPWMAGLVLPMGLVMSACGDGEVDTTGDAEQLHEAQPPHYRDATQVPEGSENGVYSELVTVQHSAEVRDTTELDKPECLDASNQWSDLDIVQDAPASVAAYEWDQGTVSSMLLRLTEEDVTEALHNRPPESCAEYTATYEDGSSSEYGISDLDLDVVGDESRAFAVEVSSGGEESHLLSLMYRNGDLLGTTSVLGNGSVEDYEEMLIGFSEAAVERQQDTLG